MVSRLLTRWKSLLPEIEYSMIYVAMHAEPVDYQQSDSDDQKQYFDVIGKTSSGLISYVACSMHRTYDTPEHASEERRWAG
eukprot:m.330648 g.330648  ORF g.330648 m.330648 type:complete len:81 (-) comp20463_c1_seq3:2322-2564(-)